MSSKGKPSKRKIAQSPSYPSSSRVKVECVEPKCSMDINPVDESSSDGNDGANDEYNPNISFLEYAHRDKEEDTTFDEAMISENVL